jgi:hypothetical protein
MAGAMRTIPALTLVLAVLVGVSAVVADEAGALQVTCRPGHRVYLDGEFVGLTAAEQDGLHLKAVAAGPHEIRVEKLGFKPRTLPVTVLVGRAVEVRVSDLEPETPNEPASAPTETPASASSAAAPAVVAASVAVAAAPVAATAAESPAPAPAAAAVGTPASAPAAEAALSPPDPARAAEPAAAALADAAPAISAAAAAAPVRRPRHGGAPIGPGVAFVYRAGGDALAAAPGGERSVSIFRERGGPRVPVLASVCVAPTAGCREDTSAAFEPGSFRFRVVCREAAAERRQPAAYAEEVALELEAGSGHTYEISVTFADAPRRCSATVTALE